MEYWNKDIGKRKRFIHGGFNLDLTYITDRYIKMRKNLII